MYTLASYIPLLIDLQISPEELVTSVPVQNLYDLFDELYRFRQHFISITLMLFMHLKSDRRANRLKDLFLPFNEYMLIVTREMQGALANAEYYYAHGREEIGEDLAKITTEQQVKALLDIISRRNRIFYGERVIASLEEAIPVLNDHALPLLPDIERELKVFVEDYQERHHVTQKRAQLWIPLAVHDIIWGSPEPTTRDISKIEVLPEQLDNGIQYLRKLLKFLEDLKNHFRRMTNITRTDYESLGYSSTEGFKCLYVNRVRCSSLFSNMGLRALELSSPFIITEDSKRDGDAGSGPNFHKVT
jgi:hypothetical protein